MRPTWIEIDLGAIAHNVASVGDAVAPAMVCAVVKADAYGHGDVPVANAALASGATWLAVALVEEGVRLREAGIEAPILVLSEPPLNVAAEIVEWSLTPTVYTEVFVSALIEQVTSGDVLDVHLKLDTGMHRVGAAPTEALRLARMIDTSGRLTLAGVWTHFAVADEDDGFTTEQLERFEAFLAILATDAIHPPLIHAANTPGALGRTDARFSMVRLGLGMYGMQPARGIGAGLQPAMRVVSHVSHVARHPAGTRPSYGRRRALERESTVATAQIGYADGVPRRLSSLGAAVLVHGERHPFAGTITMDQIVIDVGDESVAVGDEVVLLGAQGDDQIAADEWAELLGTINYEIVCGFGSRIPRRYIGGAL